MALSAVGDAVGALLVELGAEDNKEPFPPDEGCSEAPGSDFPFISAASESLEDVKTFREVPFEELDGAGEVAARFLRALMEWAALVRKDDVDGLFDGPD